MSQGATWRDLFAVWDLLEADLHATYGLDLDDPPERDWHWLHARIRRLLLDPSSVLSRATARR